MYDKTSSPPLVNIIGQSVTFNSENNKRSCGNDQIILIWGVDNYEELILYGVTNPVLASNSHFDLLFSLQTSFNKEQCLNELFINISAEPLGNISYDISHEFTVLCTVTGSGSSVLTNTTTLYLISATLLLTFIFMVLMCF